MKHSNITPENITNLSRDSIFVFGSSLRGDHKGGAARIATERFGAIPGIGAGLQGQSYAIPSTEGLDTLRLYIDQFIAVSMIMDYCKFYVTRIGCGNAGYTDEQVAPLFIKAFGRKNIYLPESFVRIIKEIKAKNYDEEMSGMVFGFKNNGTSL